MTNWTVQPTCFAIFDQQEQCVLQLPVLVYSESCLAGRTRRRLRG